MLRDDAAYAEKAAEVAAMARMSPSCWRGSA